MDHWELVRPDKRDELKLILEAHGLHIDDLLGVDLWILINPTIRDDLRLLMAEQDLELQEFINNSMTMMKWAITTVKEGWVVGAMDEVNQQWRELQMAMLDKYRIAS